MKVEGTLIIDGLIEGKIPALPGAEDKLRAWVNFARAAGLDFDLQLDGGAFSLLADNSARSAKKFAPEPSEIISSALAEMLKTIPPADRGRLTSTLRSIEYRPRQEVQTLYQITPDGIVDPHQRIIDAQTHAPPPPLTLKERLRMGLFGLAAAVAVLALSAVFVDYRKLWREIREEVTTLSVDQIQVENSTFDDYFTVAKKDLSPDTRSLRLLFRRTPKFPITDVDRATAINLPATQPFDQLTRESIVRGYVRYEAFDSKGTFQSSNFIRIKPLRESEFMEVTLPLPADARPGRIVFTN